MFGAIALLALQAAQSLSYAAPAPEILKLLQESYNPAQQVEEIGDGHSIAGCSNVALKFSVEDPILKNEGSVQAEIYQPTSAADRSIILLPPTGGENFFDRGYANSLCSSGFRVIILQSWAHDTEATLDMGMHDRNAVRAMSAVRHVLDYLKPAANEPVGIFGTSVGALTSALALNFDSRLKAAVLIVGGVNMPEIIATSTEQGVSKLREARMQQLGLKTQEEYLELLKKNVKIEPSDFMGFTGSKKVLAVVGTEDVTVPTHLQREMVREFGAESIEHAANHTSTIFWAFMNQRAKFTEFFQRSLY